MRPDLLSILICPTCRSSKLELVATARDEREIREGFVFCPNCTVCYPVEAGIVDLLGDPPETIVREQQGWLKLLGETTPDLDAHMLQLPYLSDPHWWPHAVNFDGLLKHTHLSNARVLDIGSGRTWSARWLIRHGAKYVVAVDILRQKYIGLETAELFFEHDQIYFERLLCDMEVLPFRPNSFDAVFSTASLHHALDLHRTFAALNSVLRPQGTVLIVNEPVHAYGTTRDLSDCAEVAVGINEHTYTLEEWIHAVEGAGFSFQVFMPDSITRACAEGRIGEVLVPRSHDNYLPQLLNSIWGQQLLRWQPVTINAYYDYAMPLVMIAKKQREVSNYGYNTPPASRIIRLQREASRIAARRVVDAFSGMLHWRHHAFTALSRLTPRRTTLPLLQAIEQSGTQGFYPVEQTPEGQTFCWTEPNAQVVLERPPEARSLQMVLALPPVARQLTILIDDIPSYSLRSQTTNHIGPWRQIALKLPPAASERLTVKFQLDRPWSPTETEQNGDARILGVALAELAYG